MTKIFVFGIDGAAPELVFDKWIDDLPNLKKIKNESAYARLNSTIPPVTIIAWSSMFSSKDASEIGVFAYNIKDEKTGKSKLVDSSLVKCEMLWDMIGKANKRSILLNVPLTYPVKPVNGIMVSDFLTPSIESDCAYPESIKEKIRKLGDTDNFFDVSALAGYKDMDADILIKKSYEMTKMQLSLMQDLAKNEKWDLFIQVIIGTDRLQHMLWRHFDSTHRKFIENSKHKDALKDFYKFLDSELGKLIKTLDKDTILIVASDHGMIKQEGKININNWLIEKGYLTLKEDFKKEIAEKKKARVKVEGIDMEKTLAYATGAYHARIFINKKKAGKDYSKVREKLIKEIKEIPDDKKKPMKTEVFKSEEVYKNPKNPECPDLTVYFDELRWASNPDFGMEGLYSWETAAGADNAGHSKQGIFMIRGNGIKKGDLGEIDICQVTPTILKLLDLKIPKDNKYKPVI